MSELTAKSDSPMTELPNQKSPDKMAVMAEATPPLIGTLETALYADDLESATAFWHDIMGLSVISAVPGRHVFFRVSESPVQVLLVFRAEATLIPPTPDAKFPAPPHGSRGPGHFCLAASKDQIEGWKTHLAKHGVEIEADFYWPSGGRSIYFRDPAGNSIEIADPVIWS